MKKVFKFNNWKYEIINNSPKYGYNCKIYKNDKLIYTFGAFIEKSMAFEHIRKYIIENEFDIELSGNF